MPSVRLKPGREKSLARRHPWIFSGALADADLGITPGETVEILTADGKWCARGAYSPRSQIRVRVWTFDEAECISPTFFRVRLERALALRKALGGKCEGTAQRLVNAESDGPPPPVIDRYGEYVVCQFTTAGAEIWRREILAQLGQIVPSAGVYERSDVDIREKEGLPPRTGILSGQAPPETVQIREGQCGYLVDVIRGHKTGFYLDQRENRQRAMEFAPGAEVLDCFSYTGGFAIACLRAGAASVTAVESSSTALQLARRNAELNGLDTQRLTIVEADVFAALRSFRDRGRQFDLIILDPPRFMETSGQLHRAGRAYKDINLLAFKLLRPGGTLLTFSCSGLLEAAVFQKIVADAALDAGREARILYRLTQASDHAP
ncbi:MAG: class I SAM-dependent methyltransferase, partial [Kiritimatiellae bacterium]|nr:class I SAM-dependent methyltransferase [Kiritimatiellia bacterium]